MKLLEITTNTTPGIFYHVTFKSRLKSILKNGITSGHKRNWNNAFGAKLGKNDQVYIFTDFTSAVRWAARMEWDFEKDIVIIRLRFDGDHSRDDHWENDGTWWSTSSHISPDQIIDVIPLVLTMKQEVAQTGKATPPA